MFKVIDGNLTTIFNKVQNVSSGFNLASNQVNRFVDGFNRLNSSQNFGSKWESFLNGASLRNANVASYFEELAKQGASARANIQGVYAAILDGNTRGISNVKSIINTFNSVNPQNQKDFAAAVGQTNVQLGNYLSNVQGANATMPGYVRQLVATKAATIGLRIATIALNTALFAGVSWLISKGIQAFSNLVKHIEITKEKVEDLISTYESALDSANSKAKRVEEIVNKFDKLSDGVNNLGENISLTNEEYEEYNSLVNEIADMFPTLVQGYTDEGNAILNLKGNVESLRDAYKEAQQEAYNLLIVDGKDSDGNDIIKQWTNTHDTGFFADLFDLGADDIYGNISVTEAVEQLKAIQNMSAERYREIERIASSGTRNEILSLSEIEKEIGYGSYLHKALGLENGISDEDFAIAKRQAKVLAQTYNAEIESALADVRTLANAYLMTNEDYNKLDGQSKTVISRLVNSIDSEIANSFESKNDVGVYVNSLIETILSNTDAKNALINLFSLDLSKTSADDYINQVNSYINTISTSLNENPVELKARLGFNDKEIKNRVDDTSEAIKKDGVPTVKSLTEEYKNLADAIDKVISKQSKLTEIYKKIMKGETFSREEMLGYLNEFPDLLDAVSTTADGKFTFTLDNVKVEMDKSNDDLTNQIQAKIDEAAKGVNVSIEDYFKSDKGYQAAFSKASTGFRSNADASAFNERYFAEHKGEYDEYIQCQEKNYNQLSNVLGLVDDDLISQAEHLELLNERYKNSVDNITQYNSSLDDIQDTINSVNAGQGLNYEQMTKLLAIDPSISNSVAERNGLYYVEIQALNDLKKARQEEQKAAINLEKKKTEALIVQTRQRIEAMAREMATSFVKREQLQGDYDLLSNLLEGYKKILNSLDEYEYDPTQNNSSSGSSGVSDILQQQIDRYEVLLNAIEIVSNKRIELLEAEKEALQDKNDEEQRELDLIEAKNNLDKAKKMKTIVYEKGKGFVQVENKKAISDAQKEYDDAVLEKRTAEIDKQIESTENYAKSFTEMRSDIEDAITVEQAKKALKTDENGLLSLDEKTAKNIRDGLAEAVLKKDKQDNSGNPYYQPVTLDSFLKSLGATVTGEQARAILSDSLNNMKFPQTNMQAFNSNTTNNSYVNNTSSSSNRNITINPVFNIYDASDPAKIRSEIDGYFRDIAREIK